jgi:ABC-type polysaccharide/polyol phosphate transport system ATPase subunit
MNGEPLVELCGVWKGFQRHASRLLLRSHLRRRLAGEKQPDLFYALKDVSFRMQHGEGLAVIGANGAGKSTLLSMVAGLVPPDRGTVAVNGRVALLELGSGFHPDLTGAENVRLNAAMLGIGRKRLEAILPEIVDFAEIGDFLDEPLRTYSTGMMMRLAFSVAIHVDPDILLVDEVLSVGDAAFQTKCFDRVLQFRRKGKSILCVSHASGTVQQLCDRAIWLDRGDLALDGPIGEVNDAYLGCGGRRERPAAP